ncbi:MAG: O-antigen ligase family protein [Salibacteraceae bacterium]
MIFAKKLKQNKTWLVTIWLTAVVVYLPWVHDPALYPKWLALAVLTLIYPFLQKLKNLPSSALNLGWFFILFIVFLTPSTIFSANAADGFMTWFKWVLMFSWVWMMLTMFSKEQFNQAVPRIASIILAIVGCWGLAEWVTALDGFTLTHNGTYDVSASLGHRNLLAQFVVVLMPLAALSVLNERKWWRYLGMASLFLGLFLAVALLNRTAWFSIALFVVITILFYGKDIFYDPRWRNRAISVILVGFSALILTVLLVDEFYTLIHQFETAFDLSEGTTRDRWLLAKRSFILWTQSPWLGVGSGMWKVAIMQFSQEGMLSENASLFYQRPHNDYLWVLSESGIVNGLLYLSLHIWVAQRSIKNWLKSKNSINTALLMAWIGFIITSLTGFPIERAEFMLLQGTLIAAIVINSPSANHVKYSKSTTTVSFITTTIIVLVFGWRMISELHYFEGRKAGSQQNWTRSLSEMEHARSPVLSIDASSTPIIHHIGQIQYQSSQFEQACASFEQSLTINPHHPETWNSMALCAIQKDQINHAFDCLERAVEFTPSYQSAWLNIAILRYNEGDWRLAFKSFLKADSTGGTESYKLLGERLAKDSLDHMLPHIKERKMYLTIQAFRNTPEWSLSLIQKCATNNIPFHEQVYLDACYYMLKNCEYYEDCDIVDQLIKQYLPNGKVDLNVHYNP